MNLPKPPRANATHALWEEYWSTCKDILTSENFRLYKELAQANKIIKKLPQ